MPDLISARHIERIDTVLEQIEVLLNDYSDRLDDRTTPVPPGVASNAAGLVAEARDIVSRGATRLHFPRLDPAEPVTPGDLFVALLMTRVALTQFALRMAPEEAQKRQDA